MAQSVPLSGAVIVSTPQDIALIDARKGLNMFRKVDVPVLGIVENMSYFSCPNCGRRTDIFAHGGAQREAEKLQTSIPGRDSARHPDPRNLGCRHADRGAAARISPHSAAYRAVAEQVWRQLNDQPLRPAPTCELDVQCVAGAERWRWVYSAAAGLARASEHSD